MVIDFSRLNNAPSVGSTSRTSNTKETGKTESASTGAAVEAGKTGESVHLSGEAQQLKKITDTLRDQPAVNSARVAELKQELQTAVIRWTATGWPASCSISKPSASPELAVDFLDA